MGLLWGLLLGCGRRFRARMQLLLVGAMRSREEFWVEVLNAKPYSGLVPFRCARMFSGRTLALFMHDRIHVMVTM